MRLNNLCQLRVRFSLWLSLFLLGLSLDKYCINTKPVHHGGYRWSLNNGLLIIESSTNRNLTVQRALCNFM